MFGNYHYLYLNNLIIYLKQLKFNNNNTKINSCS